MTPASFEHFMRYAIAEVLGRYGHSPVITVTVDDQSECHIAGRADIEVDWGEDTQAFGLEVAARWTPKSWSDESRYEFRWDDDDWQPLSELWAWMYFRLLDEKEDSA